MTCECYQIGGRFIAEDPDCEVHGQQFVDEREADIAAAVAAEREQCARLAESRCMGDNNREDAEARRIADAIRARSEQREG